MDPTSNFYMDYSIKKNSLDQFISQFTFIPNLFGHQRNDPNATTFNRIIGDFELIYVIDGKSIITIDNSIFNLQPGDAIIIPPFTRHSIDTTKDMPHNNYWLHFDINPLYKQKQFLDTILPNNQFKFNVGLNQKLIGIYEKIEREYQSKSLCYVTYIQSYLLQAFIEFFRYLDLNITQNIRYQKEHSIVDLAIEYINKNLTSPIKIVDVCNHLHICESTLSKMFSKVLGISVGKYIRLTKIKNAELMLKTTNITINELSETFGFSSAYHFSVVFKKTYGVPPIEYRQKYI